MSRTSRRCPPGWVLALALAPSLGCLVEASVVGLDLPPDRSKAPSSAGRSGHRAPERPLEVEELACYDADGEPAMPVELPPGPSLPALAMWLPKVRGVGAGPLPPLVLEPEAAQSEPPLLSFRRSPAEIVSTVPSRVGALRRCSDQIRRAHGDLDPVQFDSVITGTVDPLGRHVDVEVRATTDDVLQLEFASCASEALQQEPLFGWGSRHTPAYTRFELPIRFTGRPDLHRDRMRGCHMSRYVPPHADGVVECRAEGARHGVRVDELAVTFTGQSTGDVEIQVARERTKYEYQQGLAMFAVEGRVPELADCRPESPAMAVMDALLSVDQDDRVSAVLGANDCVRDALLGLNLPKGRYGTGRHHSLIIVWSSPGLGLTADEIEQLRAAHYPAHILSELEPTLGSSSLARRVCPPELWDLQRRIERAFGRIGADQEQAIDDLALALLQMERSSARICIDAIAPALLPILTWPVAVDGPVEGAIGLYEAGDRSWDWLLVLDAVGTKGELRDRLRDFVQDVDEELMWTLSHQRWVRSAGAR